MLKEYRVMSRRTELVEIARFQAEESTLDGRVSALVRQARQEGDIDRGQLNAAGPMVVAQQLGEGDALGHPGQPAVDHHFAYDADGRPLDQRQTRLTVVNGSYILEGSRNNGHDFEEVVGAFQDEAIAEKIAVFWKAGHLG